MKKICPRCSESFTCRQDRSEVCRCMHVCLNVGVREYVKQNYDACLCPTCLKETSACFFAMGVNPKYGEKKEITI